LQPRTGTRRGAREGIHIPNVRVAAPVPVHPKRGPQTDAHLVGVARHVEQHERAVRQLDVDVVSRRDSRRRRRGSVGGGRADGRRVFPGEASFGVAERGIERAVDEGRLFPELAQHRVLFEVAD
jgi:hypothetical protein